ncbi:hypothetical protein ACFOQM_03970 [Paenibacillus sp. GCM10012307]|uniref:Uncharacterized protein n=1 Tax=Paenibacillus roseus TaxID=2798579 RepID=A0A934J4V8_9BACL|nr:hypothetical protein [Paenibacillus roseus]MBJ6360470.1 hypothetical protein [Paenibacillus roseus]
MGMLYEIITRALDKRKQASAAKPYKADLVLKASHLEAERKLRMFYAQEEVPSFAGKKQQ